MAEIEIKVGGRPYRMACDDGQEAHLRSVAAHLDAEATALKTAFGDLPEMRMLLMAGVMVADKLESRNAELRDAEGAVKQMLAQQKGGEGEAPKKTKGGPDLFDPSGELAALKKQAAELAKAAEAAETRAAMAEAAAEEAQGRLAEAEERAGAAETRAAEAEDAAASAKSSPSQGIVKALNNKLADAEARAHALSKDMAAVEGEAAAALRDAADKVRSVTAGLNGG
jgi:cell division protein ZapA